MYDPQAQKVHANSPAVFPTVWLIAILALCVGCSPPPNTAVESPADPASLCTRIDAVLVHARDGRRLNASVHGAWQVVHGILAFGRDFQIAHRDTPSDNTKHAEVISSALDYLLDGGALNGWALRPGNAGVIAVVEEGSTTGQGHPDQWLGYLSQCDWQSQRVAREHSDTSGIPLDTPLRVAGREYSVGDLLKQAQFDIQPGQEATWTLMALSAYLPPDATWQARDGSTWTTERVVQMEADADLFSSACGGAHRLYGLAAALKRHIAARKIKNKNGSGSPDESYELNGGWAAAADSVNDAIDRARRFQQADGSFSIHSFERPGTSSDIFATLSATGHIFEVLALSLDDQRLAEPWVVRAAERLVTMLEHTADLDVECGALYHAAHGLLLYRNRICGDRDLTPSQPAGTAAAGLMPGANHFQLRVDGID